MGGGLTSSFVHTERSLKETQTEEMRGQTEYVCFGGAVDVSSLTGDAGGAR